MAATSSNALFVLKLIGSMFSIITILITIAVVLLLTTGSIPDNGKEFKGLIVSAGILAFSTAVISFFVWWIVSHKNWFPQNQN